MPEAQPDGGAEAIAAFAESRELACEESGRVRSATPALFRGGSADVASLVDGELAPGLTGQLFQLSPGAETGGSTAILTEVPETVAYSSTIACHDRREVGRAKPIKYPTEKWEEVRLESLGFEERFRLLVLSGQDAGWIRELFSPALIDWLVAEAPEGLYFELNEGWLCILLPGTLADAGAVASFCSDAASLTKRIRDEALEEGDFPNLFKAAEGTKRVDAAVAEIEWDEPPASVRDAAAAYMKVAERKPSVLFKALLWGLGALVIAGAFGWLLGGPFGALAAGAFGFLGGYGISRPLIADQYRFEGSLSVDWTGAQAFNREYARSRGLERQKIFQFHHDYRGLPVPGKADSVQAGEIPVAGIPGLFVMLSDSPELRASGRSGMTPDDGRPGSYDVLVADLSPAPEPVAVEALDPPEGYSVALMDERPGTVVVSRPIAGNLTRTAADCDEFRRVGGELVSGLRSPS